MRATVLRDFFLGRASAQELADDAETAYVMHSLGSTQLVWEDLEEEFSLTVDHLVRLCDAVEAGSLRADRLSPIGFGLIADDSFVWDTDTPEGERIGATLYDWSAPEINYALSARTVAKFRRRLLTGEDTFTRDDFYSRRPDEEL